MMVGGTFSAQADDVVLFTTNFSTTDGWTTENIITEETTSATRTIKGTTISFKGHKTTNLSVAAGANGGTLTFTSNNLSASAGAASGANYYMAIPVTGINGGVLKVTTTGEATRWYYSYDDGNEGQIVARLQASANGGFTIEGLTSSSATLYIGSNGKTLNSITISTNEPSSLPESDLAVASETKEMKVGDVWTLEKGVDYTTTSTGEIAISSDKAILTVDGNTVTAVSCGTATLSIAQEETAEMQAGIKKITVNVIYEVPGAMTWDFSTTAPENDGEMNGIIWNTSAGVINDKSNAGNAKDASNTYVGVVGLKVNSSTNVYFNIPETAAGKVTVEFVNRYEEATAISLLMNGAEEKTASGTWNVPAGTKKVAFTRGSKTKEAAITSIKWEPTTDVEISAAGYASFFDSGLAVELPTGVEAYVAYMDGSDFKFESAYAAGDVVPAKTAVVLKGNADTYTLTYTSGGIAPAQNALQGTDAAATTEGTDCYFYALQEGAHGVGFYWMEDNGAAFENGAHKAYLTLPKTPAARSFYAFDDATSINAVSAEQTSGAAFNLAGQRTNAAKGLLIRNGKMMFVK